MTALENLKSVYKEHYKDTASIEIYTPVVTQWKDYRYNIFTGKITLDDYVGSVENSPIKFLGHRAKPFVDLGGMRSSSYMIYKKSSKKEDDDENKEPEYVISEIYKKKYSDDLKGGRHSNKKLKDIAEICFNENIKPLLMLIVHAIDKNGFEENPNLTNTLLKSISNAIITNVEGLQTDLITISIKKQKLFPEGKGLGTEFQSALNTLKKESNDINKINNLKSAFSDIASALNTIENGDILQNNKNNSKIAEKLTEIDTIKKEIQQINNALKEFVEKNIITPGRNALDLVQHTQYFKDFSGKQLLMKMIILESVRDNCCPDLKYQLPIITKAETINSLYEDFCDTADSDNLTRTAKSLALFQTCFQILKKQTSEEQAKKQTSEEQAEKQTSEEQAEKQTSEEQAKKQTSEEQAEKQTPEEQAEKQTSEEQAEKQTPEEQAEKQTSEEQAEKQTPEEPTFKDLIEIGYLLWDYKEANILDVSDETPNVIYYGSPGTGKTYTVTKGINLKLASDLEEAKPENKQTIDAIKADRTKIVQCHPGFGYEEFIEGLKPVGFTENGTLKLEPVNGTFKTLCIRARDNRNKKYYFVADEINRANLSAMFGETLSLLETDYRDFKEEIEVEIKENVEIRNKVEKRNIVETPMSQLIEAYFNDKIKNQQTKLKEILDNIKEKVYECDLIFGDQKWELSAWCATEKAQRPTPETLTKIKNVKFGIPRNIYFIGMMNDVDKSIDAFDLALRRRFKWIRKDCSYQVLLRELYRENIKADSVDRYCQACKDLNNSISGGKLNFGKPYEFGHAYFMKIKNYVNESTKTITGSSVRKLFQEHLEPVLREYIRSFREESEIDEQINKIKDDFLKLFDSKNIKTDADADQIVEEKDAQEDDE